MDVALLNERVTFQRNEAVVDGVGNHMNVWTDYYTCAATIGGEGLASSGETQEAGMTVEDVSMTVTVRYCRKAVDIMPTGCRVLFRGEVYDIVIVDHMNFKKRTLKFTCRKVRR